MTSERLIAAIDRAEAALIRLETAGGRAAAEARRHARLRQQVTAAAARLDLLIGEE